MEKILSLLLTMLMGLFITSCSDDDGDYEYYPNHHNNYSYDDYDDCHTCGHANKTGGYCKRTVCDGSRYCWQHR